MRVFSPSTQKLISEGIGGLVMGLGYTTGAYTGYGVSNTVDPIGVHSQAKAYNRPQYVKIGMSYGGYSYGRRRYRRSRYSGYRRYSRYGYRRRSYRRYSRYY